MSIPGLAREVSALTALEKIVARHKDEARSRLVQSLREVGTDRAGSFVGEVKVGSVALEGGKRSAQVTDADELLEWCLANRPSEVETPEPVSRVRPAFIKALLAEALKDGTVLTEDGEVVPGIGLGAPSAARLVHRWEDGGEVHIGEAWSAGLVELPWLPAVES